MLTACLTCQNPCSWHVFRGTAKAMEGLPVDIVLKLHEPTENILFLSLTFFLAWFPQHFHSSHSSSPLLVLSITYIAFCILSLLRCWHSVSQDRGPAGFWWRLWFTRFHSDFKPTTRLSCYSGCAMRCSSVWQITKQSCADTKQNQ